MDGKAGPKACKLLPGAPGGLLQPLGPELPLPYHQHWTRVVNPKSGWGQELKRETLGECLTLHRIFEDQRTPKASPGLKEGLPVRLGLRLLLVPQILRVTWVCFSREEVRSQVPMEVVGAGQGPRRNSPVLTPACAGVRACVRACVWVRVQHQGQHPTGWWERQ